MFQHTRNLILLSWAAHKKISKRENIRKHLYLARKKKSGLIVFIYSYEHPCKNTNTFAFVVIPRKPAIRLFVRIFMTKDQRVNLSDVKHTQYLFTQLPEFMKKISEK